MNESENVLGAMQRLLGSMLGAAVARTILRQAQLETSVSFPGDDPDEVRAFIAGPLSGLLAPLVGNSEASRVARQVERELAMERDWPVPDADGFVPRRSNEM